MCMFKTTLLHAHYLRSKLALLLCSKVLKLINRIFITSAKKVMFLPVFVRLFVCLFVC